MRGIGKVTENRGVMDVQSPLRIVTWDEVVHPSVSSAYMGEMLQEAAAPRAEISDSESLICLAEEEFAKFVMAQSKQVQDTADAMGFDVYDRGTKIALNEDGSLTIRSNGETLVCATEAFVRREVDSYLRSLVR
jgi:hypothetical protein